MAVMILSKDENIKIIKILDNPSEMSNIFNIKSNIKTYANIEKIDGYVLVLLDSELNNKLNKLSNELSTINSTNERKKMINEFIKSTKIFNNKNLAFVITVAIIHRMNKKMNLYMLE